MEAIVGSLIGYVAKSPGMASIVRHFCASASCHCGALQLGCWVPASFSCSGFGDRGI